MLLLVNIIIVKVLHSVVVIIIHSLIDRVYLYADASNSEIRDEVKKPRKSIRASLIEFEVEILQFRPTNRAFRDNLIPDPLKQAFAVKDMSTRIEFSRNEQFFMTNRAMVVQFLNSLCI